jgi:hypothetical protein
MAINYWQHITSGEIYAVETDDFGTVKNAAGPLHHTEYQIRPEDGMWEWDEDTAEGIYETADEYKLAYIL